MPRTKAFRKAYPDHPHTLLYNEAKEKGDKDLKVRAQRLVVQSSKTKLQAQFIQSGLEVYKEKMEEFSKASVDTAIELVKSARSEKVRADLAIEGMRHKVGTPVQKQAIKTEQTVYLTLGEKPEEREVVDI